MLRGFSARRSVTRKLLCRFYRVPTAVQPVQRSVANATAAAKQHTSENRSSTARVLKPKLDIVAAEKGGVTSQQVLLIERIVDIFREKGHLYANINPLQPVTERLADSEKVRAQLERVSLDDPSGKLTDLVNWSGSWKQKDVTVQQVLDHLTESYCGPVGCEFQHILVDEEKNWLSDRIESGIFTDSVTSDKFLHFYEIMLQSQTFDQFVHTKMRQVKRYGLEGVESMIVAADAVFEAACYHDIKNVVVGMPHRGRNNLLECLLKYPARSMFAKMQGRSLLPNGVIGTDDVLSHIAQSVDLNYGSKSVHLSLLHNPSHLEAVNPVALGKTRAQQDDVIFQPSRGKYQSKALDPDQPLRRHTSMCLTIHGDAAVSGQGVVAESIMLCNLRGYSVGGTVHLIVNNQLGFTADAKHSRSSVYASDIGKVIGVPVFHVNAEDPVAVYRVCQLAVEYRMEFGRDIIIDLIGYRRHGHNELDEPSFTQPKMYELINARPTVVDNFAERLRKDGVTNAEEDLQRRDSMWKSLSDEFDAVSKPDFTPNVSHLDGKWRGLTQGVTPAMLQAVHTGIPVEVLHEVGRASVDPGKVIVHPRLKKGHIDARLEALNRGFGIDWATAEAMALGSLLREGYNVRFAGQDSGRGTFSHRHTMLVCQQTEVRRVPLNHVKPGEGVQRPGRLHMVNSPLSEFAGLGFEFGYSWDSPNALCVWEAQFGDFFNVAQVIFDQFISSGEDKWLRQSGLTLLLPHGYDGAGPEHSSCRIERFLQQSNAPLSPVDANHPEHMTNWTVAHPTTPAQYFHLLRRQLHRNFRKPLVMASPKTLLRHGSCVSTLEDMAPGTHFQSVLDVGNPPGEATELVILCSGKLYYDLAREREAKNRAGDVALVRIEELVPFPFDRLQSVLDKYNRASQIRYVQEEPENQGSFSYVAIRFDRYWGSARGWLHYVGQPAMSPSATGIGYRHKEIQRDILDRAFQ